ncbi:MAG: GGDEF domain-containing protein [Colwelliaceae bacterium]|nr:GGDEF domain-containing protein [Colwelliaceae bacterium]
MKRLKLEFQIDDYKTLFDEAVMPMVITDKYGYFIGCSRAYFKLFDYSDKQVFDNFHPRDVSPEKQPDGRDSEEKAIEMIGLAIEQRRCSFEWMHKQQNGIEFLSHVTLDAINLRGNEIVRATIQDITEQKMLERLVKERTKELEIKTRKLELLAITDPLTNLYNRNRIDESLIQEVSRYKRYNSIFSVILIDIDHFKKINDNYGHPVGDQVLIEVSRLLKCHSREIDIVGRWGGEEFLIVLPESNLDDANTRAEYLRIHIESHYFQEVSSVTASIGVAAIKKGECNNKLIARADVALYKAKNTGRNLVCIAE